MSEQESTSPFLDGSSEDDISAANEPAGDGAADGSSGSAPDGSAASERASERASTESLRYDDAGVGEKLRDATEEALNQANFGIIQIDDEGVVQFFNAYESELSGVAPDEAEGRNFFTQVAPCTNNRLFRGRFKKGVRRGEMDERFSYTYTYKMRPTLVEVHLYRDQAGHNWIMVQKY